MIINLILIPYIYWYNKCFIYKKIDVYKITVKIFYKLDFFSYEIIEEVFSTDEYTNKQVDSVIVKIIDKLDIKYR